MYPNFNIFMEIDSDFINTQYFNRNVQVCPSSGMSPKMANHQFVIV